MRISMGDVEDTGRDARVAWVVVAVTLFQHDDAATELGRTVRGCEASYSRAHYGEIVCGHASYLDPVPCVGVLWLRQQHVDDHPDQFDIAHGQAIADHCDGGAGNGPEPLPAVERRP